MKPCTCWRTNSGKVLPLSELLNEAGTTLLRLGLFDSARNYLHRALAINDSELGSDHPTVISGLDHLAELLHSTAGVYRRQLKHEEALQIQREAVQIRRR